MMMRVTVGVCALLALMLASSGVANAQLPQVALLVGGSNPETRGDYMQDAMNGGILGCGGTQDDIDVAVAENPNYFNGTLCDLTFFFLDTVVQGGTDESCRHDCLVQKAVNGMFDLIVAVSYNYNGAIKAAAEANPEMNFGIIDSAYSPTIPNVEVFIWKEDQAGFLAGVVAAEVALELGKLTLGAVGGIPIPPVRFIPKRSHTYLLARFIHLLLSALVCLLWKPQYARMRTWEHSHALPFARESDEEYV